MTTDQVPFARQVPYNLEGHLTFPRVSGLSRAGHSQCHRPGV